MAVIAQAAEQRELLGKGRTQQYRSPASLHVTNGRMGIRPQLRPLAPATTELNEWLPGMGWGAGRVTKAPPAPTCCPQHLQE